MLASVPVGCKLRDFVWRVRVDDPVELSRTGDVESEVELSGRASPLVLRAADEVWTAARSAGTLPGQLSQAARRYSWMRPPSRSTRSMAPVASPAGSSAIGVRSWRPRCGLVWL